MQQNLLLIVYTIIGVIAVWFLTVAINRNIFLHSDADPVIYGVVPMNITDIGNQCGDDYVNSTIRVEYKLSAEGQIQYLCPQGLWPIQTKITAVRLSDEFRNSLQPQQADTLLKTYPLQSQVAPVNPYITGQAPALTP